MPELPEVHTTVEGIRKEVVGKTIEDVWSDFHVDTAHGHRNNLKNKKHYTDFVKTVVGSKIIGSERRGKNILIHLRLKSDLKKAPKGLTFGYTIVIHMKMTGHLMVGKYIKIQKTNLKNKKIWIAKEKGPLQDPYNQYIHFVLTLSNGKSLVLSDMRKFASVCLVETNKINEHEGLKNLGPNPFDISRKKFIELIKIASNSKKTAPIKSILMDQNVLAGIGNIYSDEILFAVSVHPESVAKSVPEKKISEIYNEMIKILKFSIKHGGDSKSDYRNIYGEKGGFQNFHKVYGKKGAPCPKGSCPGIIQRIVVRGRSSHFCPNHQRLYK